MSEVGDPEATGDAPAPRARRRRTPSGGGASDTAEGAASPEAARRRRSRPQLARTPQGARLLAAAVALALLGGAVGGAWATGALTRTGHALVQHGLAASAEAGLAVESVQVTGRARTDRDLLRRSLGVTAGQPILAIEPERAQARIEALPWVRAASVAVRLPHTVAVSITERQPAAVWDRGDSRRVVDRRGELLPAGVTAPAGPDMPVVTGAAAAPAVPELVDLLRNHPELGERLSYAARRDERRWDLHLTDGPVLRLPAREPGAALTRFSAMEAEHALTERAIAAVDLRLSDRVVVKLERPAAEIFDPELDTVSAERSQRGTP